MIVKGDQRRVNAKRDTRPGQMKVENSGRVGFGCSSKGSFNEREKERERDE